MARVYVPRDGTDSSGRGRALTRVTLTRGWVGGWLGWVGDLSEKIAGEMGGNKDSGHNGHLGSHGFCRGRRREVDVSPQRGNYLNAHGSWDPHISGSVSCCLFRAASYHV